VPGVGPTASIAASGGWAALRRGPPGPFRGSKRNARISSLGQLLGSREPGIGCDECFEEIGRYVALRPEVVTPGQPAGGGFEADPCGKASTKTLARRGGFDDVGGTT
jgi:hypothetical protein